MNVSQLIATSFVTGAELGVIALGLSLSYAVLRFTNFAHVELVTVGAYVAWAAVKAGVPLIPAALVAMLLAGVLAMAIDFIVFRRLRQASAGGKMIASVGVGLVIRTLVQIAFGTEPQDFPAVSSSLPPVLGARITTLQVAIIALTLTSMVVLWLVLYRTKMGTALRAAADNFPLALARGVAGEQTISFMWFLSGVFAAFGGILIALETVLTPSIGSFVIMPAFASASVGGLGSPYGAVAGALTLAFGQNILVSVDFGSLLGVGPWRLSPNYKDAIALGALILTLLIRPSGLLSPRTARR